MRVLSEFHSGHLLNHYLGSTYNNRMYNMYSNCSVPLSNADAVAGLPDDSPLCSESRARARREGCAAAGALLR